MTCAIAHQDDGLVPESLEAPEHDDDREVPDLERIRARIEARIDGDLVFSKEFVQFRVRLIRHGLSAFQIRKDVRRHRQSSPRSWQARLENGLDEVKGK